MFESHYRYDHGFSHRGHNDVPSVRCARNTTRAYGIWGSSRIACPWITSARLLAQLGEQVGTLLLPEFMYERAAINAALAVRRPVWRTLLGEAHSLAAEEVHRVMRAIWERLQ